MSSLPNRDWSDRDRIAAAKRPAAWTTTPAVVTREDLFNELDLLKQRLAEKDGLLDSGIHASIVRARSLAATLCPKPPMFVCGFDYGNGATCRVGFQSEAARSAHWRLVHDYEAEVAA